MTALEKHWVIVKSELKNTKIISKEETIKRLKENKLYKTLEGKAKNRTLIKKDKELYVSIYEYTKELEDVFVKQGSWSGSYNFYKRVLFLAELEGDLEKLKCMCGRKYGWTLYCRHCPDYKRNQLGKPHTEETKRKQRISALEYLKSIKGQVIPRYNKSSIEVIENYGNENGYKFIHAENGGEYFIKELGYFIDAYDPISNVALEIDEKRHFDVNGQLKEEDIERQRQIIELLGCKFIRIKHD